MLRSMGNLTDGHIIEQLDGNCMALDTWPDVVGY